MSKYAKTERLFTRLFNSFKNKHNSDFSARKLTSFVFVLMMGYVHYAHVDNSNSVDVLIVDSAVILILLGIITVQDIIHFKNGNDDKPAAND